MFPPEPQPWRSEPCACWYCGKVLPSHQSKNVHLLHCPKRLLLRFIKVQNILFIIRSNPQKKRIRAFERLILEHNQPKLLIGALNYSQYVGHIVGYSIWEIKTKAFQEHENGLLTFGVIKKKTTTTERADIQQLVNELVAKPVLPIEAIGKKKMG